MDPLLSIDLWIVTIQSDLQFEELTPEDDHRVDSQGRAFINGVAMDPGDFGSNTLSLENQPESGRQLPPLPEDGMLVNLDNESKVTCMASSGHDKDWENTLEGVCGLL